MKLLQQLLGEKRIDTKVEAWNVMMRAVLNVLSEDYHFPEQERKQFIQRLQKAMVAEIRRGTE